MRPATVTILSASHKVTELIHDGTHFALQNEPASAHAAQVCRAVLHQICSRASRPCPSAGGMGHVQHRAAEVVAGLMQSKGSRGRGW